MPFTIQRLLQLISQLEQKVPVFEKLNLQVSTATVGWHIEHSLLTIDIIIYALQKSKPSNFKKKFNFIKWLVLTTKTIPRGRAKSPDVVVPKNTITIETLQDHFQNTIENTKVLATLQSQQYFPHPYFGDLRVKQAIKFLEIHTNHHLKIARDIVDRG